MFRDRLLEGDARPLAELGLPPGEEVDAVFSWPLNGKTYLVRGHRYWRYDEAAARPDPGYPRDLSLWEGAPPSPDDVAVSNDGRRARAPACKPLALGWGLEVTPGAQRSPWVGEGGSGQPAPSLQRFARLAGDTYFFKGAHYWRFPKGSVKAEPDSPQPMGPQWLDCPAPSGGPRYPRPPKATVKPGPCNCHCEINRAAGRLSSSSPSVPLLLLLLALLVGDISSR